MRKGIKHKILKPLSKEDRKQLLLDTEEKKLLAVVAKLAKQNSEIKSEPTTGLHHPIIQAWYRHHPQDQQHDDLVDTQSSLSTLSLSSSSLSLSSSSSSSAAGESKGIKVKVEPYCTEMVDAVDVKPNHSVNSRSISKMEQKVGEATPTPIPTQIPPIHIQPTKLTLDRTTPEWLALWSRVLLKQNVLSDGPSMSGKSLSMTTLVNALHHTQPALRIMILTGGSYLVAKHLERYLPGNYEIETFVGWLAPALRQGTSDPTEMFFSRCLAEIDIVLIDDFHAVDGNHFQLFIDIVKHKRHNLDLPFGGLQVVCWADFAHATSIQLLNSQPFVADHFERPLIRLVNASIPKRVMPTSVITDPEWYRLLQFLRSGKSNEWIDHIILNINISSSNNLASSSRPLIDIVPTEQDASRLNQTRLDALTTQRVVYKSHEFIRFAPVASHGQRNELMDAMIGLSEETCTIAPFRLKLAIGSQVILTMAQNGIDVGTVGTVLSFSVKEQNPIIDFRVATITVEPHVWKKHFDVGSVVRIQMPLLIAWGLPWRLVMGIRRHAPLCTVWYRIRLSHFTSEWTEGTAYSLLSLADQRSDMFLVSDWNASLVKASPIMLKLCQVSESTFIQKQQ